MRLTDIRTDQNFSIVADFESQSSSACTHRYRHTVSTGSKVCKGKRERTLFTQTIRFE